MEKTRVHVRIGTEFIHWSVSIPTTNPLGQVLHALDEPLRCIRYNTWKVHFPEATFVTEVGNDQFIECLEKYYDAEAVADWRKLKEKMEP